MTSIRHLEARKKTQGWSAFPNRHLVPLRDRLSLPNRIRSRHCASHPEDAAHPQSSGNVGRSTPTRESCEENTSPQTSGYRCDRIRLSTRLMIRKTTKIRRLGDECSSSVNSGCAYLSDTPCCLLAKAAKGLPRPLSQHRPTW